MRLLFAHDDAPLAQEAKAYLDSRDDLVLRTCHISNAWDTAEAEVYDAMVSLSTSSEESLRLLEEAGKRRLHLPLMVMTPNRWEGLLDEIIELGADHYLISEDKPSIQMAEVMHILLKNVERAKAERALRQSEQRFRDLAESINDVFFALDHENNIVYWNNVVEELSGKGSEEAVGMNLFSVFPCLRSAEGVVLIERAIKERRPGSFIEEMVIQGRKRYFSVSAYPSSSGCSILANDVTDLKEMESALRESEERFRGVFNNSPIAIEIYDSDGRLIDANQACLEIFGIQDIAEIRGFNLFADPNLPQLSKERLMAGRNVSFETEFDFDKVREKSLYCTSRNGRLDMEVLITPIANGELRGGFLVQVRDVSERKRMERALMEANKKLHLLGSIVRHDIMNQLVSIVGYAGLAEIDAEEERVRAMLKKVLGLSENIRAILEFGRDYERMGTSRPRWVSAEEVCSRGRSYICDSELEVSIDLGGLEIYADPMVEKVFHNLLTNACRHPLNATGIWIFYEEVDGGINIVVEDDGVGIPPQRKSTIFEGPSGRGLYLVKEILSITDIIIRETGEEGKGARFEIFVPEGRFRSSSPSQPSPKPTPE